MQSNATVELPFDRHKVVMDITFAAWCEVNKEFVEWLLCEAVHRCYVLTLMCHKECQKICQKACQKICQKECQKICQKESERISEDMSERMSKDMSERMSKDLSEDMSERMSKDMSENKSEDCFQSVCEVESNRTHFRR